MLFEMLQGEVVRGGWNDEQVKESLDLCLSCKACKSECPTNVDIATYRAEFLSHYYERHRRPLHAYAFGMVDRWLSLAAVSPMLANAMMQAPGLNGLVKRALDIAPERTVPRLASANFRTAGGAAGCARPPAATSSCGSIPSTTRFTPRRPRRPSTC